MAKRLASTPRSKVRAALRRLWLYSREHQAALKNAGRCCSKCGVKASVAKGREVKLEVHHLEGIPEWEAVINYVFDQILVPPEKLVVMCKECHAKEHRKGEVNRGE